MRPLLRFAYAPLTDRRHRARRGVHAGAEADEGRLADRARAPDDQRAESGRARAVDREDDVLRQRHRQTPRRVPRFGHDQDEDGGCVAVRVDGAAGREAAREGLGLHASEVPGQRPRVVSGGHGPFPLVLIVHGNHNPLDYSDPGYGYLGELLASRGFILVSVDENFINGGLRGESDGRAWMLLKHLEVWKRWNDSSAGPFSHKVDMNNIGIMGHSRGGEAVGIAAAFNRLSHYPDDANVKFNFNFNIKAVFAIAPVDGQYKPAGVFTPIENVNYMVIHGSHDGDVSSFNGLRAYQRIKFTDGKPWFKTAWYVYRANHGQWNTVWGNKDNGPRSGRSLDLRGLITAGRAAAVQQSGDRRLPRGDAPRQERVSADVPRPSRRSARGCRRRCTSRAFRRAASSRSPSFDEDVDVTTGSVPGVTLTGDSLATWKENPLALRNGNDPLNTNAVTLGWNNHIRGDDTTKLGRPASYTISLSDSLTSALARRTRVGDLSVARADGRQARPARAGARHDEDGRQHARRDSARNAPRRPNAKAEKDTTPVDLTVESRMPRDTWRDCRSRSSASRAVRWRFTFSAGATKSSSAIRRSTSWCCRPT